MIPENSFDESIEIVAFITFKVTMFTVFSNLAISCTFNVMISTMFRFKVFLTTMFCAVSWLSTISSMFMDHVTVRSVTVSLALTNEFAFEMNPLVVNVPAIITLFKVES